MVTYFEGEGHSAGNFAIHLGFFQNLIIFVIGGLSNVDDSPGETVLQVFNRFKEDFELDWVGEVLLILLHDHV